jgi:hypothetical protein
MPFNPTYVLKERFLDHDKSGIGIPSYRRHT